MGRASYLAVLAFVVVGSVWLEYALRTRVLRRALRLLLSLLPVVAVFVLWDAYAIARGHWTFDVDQTTGVIVVAGVPLDEVLFFIVIPFASVLTLEAVRSATGWAVGDEDGDAP